jgi:3-methyladenine DNA glycosylase AlkD
MARRAESHEPRRVVAKRRPLSRWAAGERRRILRELRAHPGSDGGEALRAYLGSPVPVLGVRADDLRSVVRATASRLRAKPLTETQPLIESLWEGKFFEERLAAIELLARPPFVRDDRGWRLGARWVSDATGWALSDSLAAGPIALGVAAHPERFGELLAWTRSGNLWRRRASTYALRPWVRAGDLDRPFELLMRLLDDPERSVQRAVGTWLRECWKKDRARTEQFLRREVTRLAPVTITVATERAPKRFREELRRANRRRPIERRGY